MKIIPSILTNDPNELSEMIAKCEGVCNRIQIDIVDGIFAENKTLDPTAIKYVDTNLKIDFHLMVANPVSWVEKCASVGANLISAQIEMMSSQLDFVKKVQSVGALCGLCVNINTQTDLLDATCLGDIDQLLLMSTPAGFGGQKFNTEVYKKIKEANLIREKDNTPYTICIDGGVNEDVISTLFKLKVDEVVIGRSLFAGVLKENIDVLLNKAKL